jgi:hypothetical protein
MVSVVLVLPPLDGESLHEISPKQTSVISIGSCLVDLVVKKVMRQPPALLEEEAHEGRSEELDSGAVTCVHEVHGKRPHAHVKGLLVNVVANVGLEKSHHDHLGSQVTVGPFKVSLMVVLVLDGFWNEFSNEKSLHHVLRSRCMKGGEDVRHVIPRVRKDDRPPRVFVPVRDIVHLVVVHHPGILGSSMLLNFRPRVLGQDLGVCHLLGILLLRLIVTGLSHACVSTLAHDE